MRTGDLLVERARTLRDRIPGLSVGEAYRRVLEADPDLARRHHQGDQGTAPAPAAAPELQDPGALLHQLALARVAAGQAETFQAALDSARRDYPSVASAYHQGRMIEGGTAPAGPDKPVVFRAMPLPFRAAAADAPAGRLVGLELFRPGKWNGRVYGLRDLQQLITAAHEIGWRIPLKLGHDTRPNVPAAGWIDPGTLRLQGDVLVGDAHDVPAEVAGLIRARRFDQLSVELFLNHEHNGRRFPVVLTAVALLGGHVPAIPGLKPLSAALPPAGA